MLNLKLGKMFNPSKVVVAGASRTRDKIGYEVLRSLIEAGFRGDIYPVNPKADKIVGLKCYPHVSEIPDCADLAIIVVPPKAVLDVAEDCGDRGVSNIITITAGFKETGPEGASLEEGLVDICKKHDMRLLGPNCVGLIDTYSHLNASFAPCMPLKGDISFISQSGALGTAILEWSLKEGIGLNKFISLGNKADLDETDFIEALCRDSKTSVILAYVENIERGHRFIKVAQKTTRRKPIILLKSGVSESGARAAASHTGSIAGRDVSYNAAFLQTGVLRAHSIEELFDYAIAFSTQPVPKNDGIAIVTNAGGPGIIATDACESYGLRLASFNASTIEHLRTNLPSNASIYNPVDVVGDAKADRFELALDAVMKDEEVGIVLLIMTPQIITEPKKTVRMLFELHQQYPHKPIITSLMGGDSFYESFNILSSNSIPCYPFADRAVSSISALVRYARILEGPSKPNFPKFEVNKRTVKKIISKVIGEGRNALLGHETTAIANAYGINTPSTELATTQDEAIEIADNIGYPVTVKISSPQILHKTDIGGVRVGLNSPKDVKAARSEVIGNARRLVPSADIYGVEIQKVIPKGTELILGMSRDPQFGPLIMFGLGGIYVNFLKDVSFRLAPMTKKSALEMIQETKAHTLLRGVRGQGAKDIDAVMDTVLRIAQLSTDFEELWELDINPLVAYPKKQGIIALDVKMTVYKEE